jgi:hypothetical protein
MPSSLQLPAKFWYIAEGQLTQAPRLKKFPLIQDAQEIHGEAGCKIPFKFAT